MMKIYVNRIPRDGLHEDTTYDPKALDMDRFDVHLEAPIHLSSFITLADHALIIQASMRCALQLNCARCLQTFERELDTTTMLTYEVTPTDIVDITDDVRQEIILAYPMVPLCQPACKGLCAVCGHNLNTGPCAHHEE